MPADLVGAIEHAHRIIDWQENLAEKEIPPQWMWHLDDEVGPFLEEVFRARREKYGTDEGREEAEMMSNDLAKGRR